MATGKLSRVPVGALVSIIAAAIIASAPIAALVTLSESMEAFK